MPMERILKSSNDTANMNARSAHHFFGTFFFFRFSILCVRSVFGWSFFLLQYGLSLHFWYSYANRKRRPDNLVIWSTLSKDNTLNSVNSQKKKKRSLSWAAARILIGVFTQNVWKKVITFLDSSWTEAQHPKLSNIILPYLMCCYSCYFSHIHRADCFYYHILTELFSENKNNNKEKVWRYNNLTVFSSRNCESMCVFLSWFFLRCQTCANCAVFSLILANAWT